MRAPWLKNACVSIRTIPRRLISPLCSIVALMSSPPPNLASEPDTYRGHDGIRRWFDSFDEVMEEIRWDAQGFQEVGDRVVVEFTLRARGKTTGLDFGQEAVMVWWLRDGKAIRVELFETLDEAIAAATGSGE